MKLKTIFLGVLLLIKGSVFAEGLPLSFTTTVNPQTSSGAPIQICYGLRNLTGIYPLPLVHQYRVNGGLWILTQGTPQCASAPEQPFEHCNACTTIPNLGVEMANVDISVCYFGRYCALSNHFSVSQRLFPTLEFIKKPAFPSNGSVNGVVFFQYDVKNVGEVAASLDNISTNVTGGTLEVDPSRTTCGSVLLPGESCTLAYRFFAPPTMGSATGSLSIEYGGVNPLETNDLAFGFENQLFIYATEGRSGPGQQNDIVSYCVIDPNTRDLTNCQSPGTPLFEDAEGIAFNALGDKAYISNGGRRTGDSISICDVNKNTGVLSGCVEQTEPLLRSPEGIAITPKNDRIYIANFMERNIVFCDILANGSFNNCKATAEGITGFAPEGIALNHDATKVYIANGDEQSTGDTVFVCDRDDSSGELSNCTQVIYPFNDPRAIALNIFDTLAYITNRDGDPVTVCDVNATSGFLENCQSAGGTNISDPEGLAIIPDGQNVYVGSWGARRITPCTVVDGQGNLNCGASTGGFPGVDDVNINGIVELPCVNAP